MTSHQPAQQGEQSDDQHGGHEHSGDPVDQALHGCS